MLCECIGMHGGKKVEFGNLIPEKLFFFGGNLCNFEGKCYHIDGYFCLSENSENSKKITFLTAFRSRILLQTDPKCCQYRQKYQLC